MVHKKVLKDLFHTAVITTLAVLLSGTLLARFTSMLAMKKSIEVSDYEMSDLYNRVSNQSAAQLCSEDIVLVPVDGLSRSEIAAVVRAVEKASPKAIGIDISFEHQFSTDSDLIAATSMPNVVLVASLVDDTTVKCSYFCDESHRARVALANVEAGFPSGIVRKYRTNYVVNADTIRTLAAELAMLYGHTVPMTDNSAYIYFHNTYFLSFDPAMLTDNPVLAGEMLSNRIVLIGDTAEIKDIHYTPIGTMSGLKIQASILDTIIGRHSIRNSPRWLAYAIAILSCFFLIWSNIRLSRKWPAIFKLFLRLVQLLLLYLYFYIGCRLFDKALLYVDFSLAITTIAIGFLVYDMWFGLLALLKIKHSNTK